MTQMAGNQSGHVLRRAAGPRDRRIDELPPGTQGRFAADGKSFVGPAFRHLVHQLDESLRHAQGIAEYSASPDCMLRVEARRSAEPVRLHDGTMIRPNDELLELHLWNEHLPRISALGPHLGWALRVRTQMRRSLAELAACLQHDPAYAGVVALHARISWSRAARSGRMLSLARRFGFRASSRLAAEAPAQRLHDFWEDFLIWGLICTFNPRSLRGAGLLRHRAELWMSRRELIESYGNNPRPAMLELSRPRECPEAG
jgi:hypothetical protein